MLDACWTARHAVSFQRRSSAAQDVVSQVTNTAKVASQHTLAAGRPAEYLVAPPTGLDLRVPGRRRGRADDDDSAPPGPASKQRIVSFATRSRLQGFNSTISSSSFARAFPLTRT